MKTQGFATVNPSTGQEIETFSFYDSAKTEGVLARADKSFQSFRKLSVHQRAQLFSQLAETLKEEQGRAREGDHQGDGQDPPRKPRRRRGRRECDSMKRTGMPNTGRKSWRMSPPLRELSTPTSHTFRLEQFWQLCPGIFRSGS